MWAWRWGVALLTYMGTARTAFAQGKEVEPLPWNWEPWVLACLLIAFSGYVYGVLRIRAGARAHVFGIWRYIAFVAGLGVLIVALISPLDTLDDQLFCAHMVQHMLLMLVAPPLIVWGRPATAFLWAFPLSARRAIGRFWMRAPGVQSGIRTLIGPTSVWIFSSFALWFWHLPGPYGWALGNETVHTGEHLCFFLTSLAFWTIVLAPYGRRQLGYGSSLLFVGTLGVQMGLLGAILTFATRPMYGMHASATIAWGLSPLEDQQLAGLIMWIPGDFLYLGVMIAMFVAWLHDAERYAIAAAAAPRDYSRQSTSFGPQRF